MKALEKIINCKDVSLETKTIHTFAFQVTLYECESWRVKKSALWTETLGCQKHEQAGPRAN